MISRILVIIVSILAVAAASLSLKPPAETAQRTSEAGIYELRVYTTNDGLLPNLHNRFRDHTNHLFVKHGMGLVGYWVPETEDNKLIYILSYPSLEARNKSWEVFREDVDWHRARDASHEQAGGAIVKHVDSTIMSPTSYSPIR